jgi:hypothetical protein
MATSETHRLASHHSRATNGHLSAVQIEPKPQQMSVGRDFPGWLCWYGRATRVWWGMPPLGYRYRALIEAATPDELAARVHEIRAANRHLAGRPHS